MGESASREPTDAELAILRVLWQRGACTVRDVHEALSETQQTGYTTKLKLLQIMTDKGLVRRTKAGRSHVYEAVDGEDETQRRFLSRVLDRMFQGSASGLVMQLLETDVSPGELKKLRGLLREHTEER